MSNSIVFDINDVDDYPTYWGNIQSFSKPIKESNKTHYISGTFPYNNQENTHVSRGDKKESLSEKVDSDFLKILVYLLKVK